MKGVPIPSFVALAILLLASSCGGGEGAPGPQLAYATYDGVFLGGEQTSFFGMLDPPKKLADDPGEFLTWDPSGERLAFLAGNDLLVTDDATRVRYLRDDAALQPWAAPSWSPDGRRVAYGCEETGAGADICVVDVSTGRVARLTDAPGFDASPAFSPDGSKIAFTSNRAAERPTDSAGDADVYVMDADGSGQTRLTRRMEVWSHLSWLPGGDGLVFSGGEYRDIYALGIGDRDPRLLVGGDTKYETDPTLSPDGTKVAFFSSPVQDEVELHVADVRGGEERTLAKGVEDSRPPSWSPDGRMIAYQYSSDAEDPANHVMVATITGSREPRRFREEDDVYSPPAWRPRPANSDGRGSQDAGR